MSYSRFLRCAVVVVVVVKLFWVVVLSDRRPPVCQSVFMQTVASAEASGQTTTGEKTVPYLHPPRTPPLHPNRCSSPLILPNNGRRRDLEKARASGKERHLDSLSQANVGGEEGDKDRKRAGGKSE